MERPDILIFDVYDRRSIPAVGSLGKKYNFHFLVPIRKGFGIEPLVRLALRIFKPRYTRSLSFASFQDENDLQKELLSFLAKRHMDAVVAFSERSTAVLCENHDRLDSLTSIPYGTFDDFNKLNDKFSILEVCRKVGVPSPRFAALDSREDLDRAKKLGYPLVLKCRLASGVKEAFRICHSDDELEKNYKELTSRAAAYSYFRCDRLVAEEFIAGPIFDCGFSVRDGEVISAVPQERLWTIPPEGGFGAFNATRALPELVDYGRRIFHEIRWTGPAQLEFIFEKKTGTYKLIEVNPRFWGTFGLSVKAGVNIADDVIRIALGDSQITGDTAPSAGITFAWLLQETLTAEKMQGKKGLIWKHIRRIFSSEINNFTYSVGANILLSLPHLMAYFGSRKKKTSPSASLAKRMFE